MVPERWRHHLDYLITLLGGSIGAGSLIKFPYLCMRNGGGLGLGIALVNWIFVTYYLAIFSWFMYYFYHSFFADLPWTSCDHSWNTPGCIDGLDSSVWNYYSTNDTQVIDSNISKVTLTVPGMTAAEEFWRFQALQMTDSLEDLGGVRWPLVGCMALTCVIMFLFVFRGINISGKVFPKVELCDVLTVALAFSIASTCIKSRIVFYIPQFEVVYVTVAVPILLVIVFIIQGSLLPGSAAGIYFFVNPNFEKLLNPKGGVYLVTLTDWYAFFPAIAVFGMLECILVSWCYGFERLKQDISTMWGEAVPRVMMLSIKYVCPLLLLAIFCSSIYSHRPPKYGDYIYPAWAAGVGWMISCISIIPLPIVFIWTVYNTPGTTLKQKLRTSFQPKNQWRRHTLSDTANNQALQPIQFVQGGECGPDDLEQETD
ncbi:sodium- and chloride-dependent GABA transporter 2-like [Haliotis rubra]|uniref:sodium- and chloride-dependent GABA transporter 2-like n=1 Tax=Haliotis rubra TaxID=36100 RepID=UPI001EE537BF|nr:sodium- and chloride-dependent GABA transporter 2-like [Haliotis rubra]